MKKIISVFTLLLAFVFAGCSCSKPFYLDDNLYNNESEVVFIDLNTFDEYQELIDSKKSFAIYVYEPGCGGCIAFTPVLTEYLKENNLTFYRIHVAIAKSQEGPIKENMEGTPSVFLFEEGEYVTFLNSRSSKEIQIEAFKSTAGFEKWFTKYVKIK
jgi:thiol-disulfide isomerase/thioredoxin